MYPGGSRRLALDRAQDGAFDGDGSLPLPDLPMAAPQPPAAPAAPEPAECGELFGVILIALIGLLLLGGDPDAA